MEGRRLEAVGHSVVVLCGVVCGVVCGVLLCVVPCIVVGTSIHI
jgi:tetrahydromethanopterin S-methyltransferase subunit F